MSETEIKTSFTQKEIANLMLRGGLIGLIAVSVPIIFMVVLWLIGFLLPEEARLAVSWAEQLMHHLPTHA